MLPVKKDPPIWPYIKGWILNMPNLMKVVLAGTELGNSNYSMVLPANFVKQIFHPPQSYELSGARKYTGY